MKDIEATLRRIDEEIVGHHQQIAGHRNEIMRLQETRLVLMGIAEGDIAAAEQARHEGMRTINGAHAKPVLIVRREGAEEVDAETAAKRKKWRDKKRDYAHERELARKRKAAALQESGDAVRRSPGRPRAKHGEASGLFRPRVLETLKGVEGGMTRQQIGDYFGLPRGETERKGLSNALYYLEHKGQIVRDKLGHFTLTQE